MDFLVYLLYRTVTLVVGALPMTLVFRLGQLGGWLGYCLLGRYRRLAIANLTIAYGGERTPAEIHRLARRHFFTLGANALASMKAVNFDAARLRECVELEGLEIIQAAFAQRRGIVLAISHIGNWEMFAQACQIIADEKWGTIYQPLANRHIEAHIQRTRRKVALFNRKSGFNAPTAFLREGGALGVLIDQHAGDGGVWTPFFGRLASTSTLAGLLALRTNALILPMAVHTAGVGRWKLVISPTVPYGDSADSPERIAARLNQVLEKQINITPTDWFWVHNRWKTPKPRFLLARYKRGVVLPENVTAADLKPFRILVRSTNWLGDAVMSIPAVRAIAAGRPDACVTVLAPAKLADLWREVPGVAEVLPIPPGAGVFQAASIVRRAGPFDVAVLLPNSLRAALEARLAGVPRRVGFAGHRRRWLLNQIVPEESTPAKPGGDPRRNQTHRYLRLAQEIGAGSVPADPPPPLRAGGERGGWLRIGLCPGAEYGPTKRWPAERFAEAAKLVAAERTCEWTIFGVEKDAPYAATIEAALGERCENLVGKTTLAELIAALRRCDALLTNDTGTMHLAAWLGVPVAAVFGSTDPVLTAPLVPPERLRVLRRQVECSPCFLKECPLDLRCLHAVAAKEAAAAVLQLLPARETGAPVR